MDSENCRSTTPAAGQPTADAGDWRVQLPADSRQRIVNKIMETLERHLPFSGPEGLRELRKIAERFEEKIYNAASSQSDYLRKISLKMLAMEAKSQSILSSSLPSKPDSMGKNQVYHSTLFPPPVQGQSLPLTSPVNQSQPQQQLLSQNIQNNLASRGVQSSSMENIIGVPQNMVGNSIGKGIPNNDVTTYQEQMQRRQLVTSQQEQQKYQNPQHYPYQLQLQQHFQKLNFQELNIPHSIMQSQTNLHEQQEQKDLLHTTQLQSSQRPENPSLSVMQPQSLPSPPLYGIQQNQSSSVPHLTLSMLQQHQQLELLQQSERASNVSANQGQQSVEHLEQQKFISHVPSQPQQQPPNTLSEDLEKWHQESDILLQHLILNDQNYAYYAEPLEPFRSTSKIGSSVVQGLVLCNCGHSAKIYTSMSKKDPLRRFAACPKSMEEGGCTFWCWYDEEMEDYLKTKVVELMEKNEDLERKLKERLIRESTAKDTSAERKMKMYARVRALERRERWWFGAVVASWILIVTLIMKGFKLDGKMPGVAFENFLEW